MPETGLDDERLRPIALPADATARILIVDDQSANVRLLERVLLRSGYREIEGITDPRLVPETVERFDPDIVLLDLHMPHLDGYAVLAHLRLRRSTGAFLPVVVLTADVSPDAKLRALSSGATDFLTKPFDPAEVTLRVSNLLHMRALHREVEAANRSLEARVRERTAQLEDSYSETLDRLARAAEHRDDDTGGHIRRVGRTAALLAAEIGMPEEDVRLIGQAAALHDVGKIGVPDAVLLKPGKLTAEEFEVVKTHTVIGARILSGSSSPLLQMAERIAGSHHERWDGAGYRGLVREATPVEARITSVADAFDAMTHDRPYRAARPVDEALEEIERERGRQFDPDIVDAFRAVIRRLADPAPPSP